MTDPFKLEQTGQGKYFLVLRETGDAIGSIRRDWSIKSWALWDAFDADGVWLRGYPSRSEAEQAVVIRYRRGGR